MRLASLAVVVAAGCATRPYLGVRPGPEGYEVRVVAEGRLWARSWLATTEPRAVLVIVHDVKDHGERYVELGRHLAARGYTTHVCDQRGFGRSAGWRNWGSLGGYLRDLHAFLAHVREPGRKLFLIGHGFGGAIATAYALAHPRALAGLVLSAPAIRFDVPAILLASSPAAVQVNAATIFAALVPGAVLLQSLDAWLLPNVWFSSDHRVVAEMTLDPLIDQAALPQILVAALHDVMHALWGGEAERLDLPLLLLHGTADRVTTPAGSRDLYERAGSRDKTIRLYDGLPHDLWRDPGRAVVIRDLDHWLDAQTAAGPPLASSPIPPRLVAERPGEATSAFVGINAFLYPDGLDLGVLTSMRRHLGNRWTYSFGFEGKLARTAFDETTRLTHYHLDLLPVGAGVRVGNHMFSVAGGAGLGGETKGRRPLRWDLPLVASLEVDLSALRLLGWGRLGWSPAEEPSVDVAYGGALLLGRAHRWPGARFGRHGLLLGVFVQHELGMWVTGLVFGIQTWGSSR